MLSIAPTPSAPIDIGAYGFSQRPLLQVRPTQRRYPLRQLLSLSPQLQQNIGLGCEGIPLRLSISLRNAIGLAIPGAAVYIWQHDPTGWTVDFVGHELNTISCMRGVQISDSHGGVCFDTVYPAQGPGHESAVFLQIYFTEQQKTTARAQVYLLLPSIGSDTQSANTLPKATRFSGDGNAAVIALHQLTVNASTSGLQGHVQIDVAI